MTDKDNQEKVKELISAIEDFVDRYRRIEKDLAQLKPIYDKDGDMVSCDASILDDKSETWVQRDIAFFDKIYCGSFDRRYQFHCKYSPNFLKIFILQLRREYIERCLESLKFFLYCKLSHFSQDDIDNKIYILDRDLKMACGGIRCIGTTLKDTGRYNNSLHKKSMMHSLSPEEREIRAKAAIAAYRSIDDLGLRKLAGMEPQGAKAELTTNPQANTGEEKPIDLDEIDHKLIEIYQKAAQKNIKPPSQTTIAKTLYKAGLTPTELKKASISKRVIKLRKAELIDEPKSKETTLSSEHICDKADTHKMKF